MNWRRFEHWTTATVAECAIHKGWSLPRAFKDTTNIWLLLNWMPDIWPDIHTNVWLLLFTSNFFIMFAFHSEYFFDLITTTEKVPLAAFSRYKKFISSPVDSNDPDLSIQLLLLLVLKFIQINLFRPSGEGERKFPFSLYFIFSFSLLLIVNSNLLFVQQFVLCNYSHSVIL